MKTIIILSIAITIAACANIYGESSNPLLALVRVSKKDASFEFMSKAYTYRDSNDRISGIAVEVDPEDKKSDTLEFFESSTTNMAKVSEDIYFAAIDHRLVDGCLFGFRYVDHKVELRFKLNGDEDSDNQYNVSIIFEPSLLENLIRSTNLLQESCEHRNNDIRKAKQNYYQYAEYYFQVKDSYTNNVTNIEASLQKDLENSEKTLKEAKHTYEKAKYYAEKAAKEKISKTEEGFQKISDLLETAKNEFISVVPVISNRVEQATKVQNTDEVLKKVNPVVCNDCEINNRK